MTSPDLSQIPRTTGLRKTGKREHALALQSAIRLAAFSYISAGKPVNLLVEAHLALPM